MEFKAKLNLKFYVVSFFLLCFVLIGWYGVYFLGTQEILMEDGTPMTFETKLLFIAVMVLIVLSWSFSLFTMIRQIIVGCAFIMDRKGISQTATATVLLAFIFVMPVREIPYSAIQNISKNEKGLTLLLDKSQIKAFPLAKPFLCKRYHLFLGFTLQKPEEIQTQLEYFRARIS